MQPAHMPTGLDYDDQRFSQLDSTRNDEGPPGHVRLTEGLGVYSARGRKAPRRNKLR
jgi:hypothetical protein